MSNNIEKLVGRATEFDHYVTTTGDNTSCLVRRYTESGLNSNVQKIINKNSAGLPPPSIIANKIITLSTVEQLKAPSVKNFINQLGDVRGRGLQHRSSLFDRKQRKPPKRSRKPRKSRHKRSRKPRKSRRKRSRKSRKSRKRSRKRRKSRKSRKRSRKRRKSRSRKTGKSRRSRSKGLNKQFLKDLRAGVVG
jgi:hypothetical protein